MAKIYLAAPYARKEEMRGYRDRLVSIGHTVTSRWLDGVPADTEEKRQLFAIMDFQDVEAAEVLVTWSRPREEPVVGGGHLVEFGIALAKNKRIIVIGPKGQHVFHGWPAVEFVDTVEDVTHHRGLLCTLLTA